jgi:hypothetical protein
LKVQFIAYRTETGKFEKERSVASPEAVRSAGILGDQLDPAFASKMFSY